MSNFNFSDVMQLDASVEQVRAFIRNPERIADYFPGITEYGTFEGENAIWCLAKSGVTLLEYPPELLTDTKVVMQVTTSQNSKPPFTVQSIKAEPFISMTEDWVLQEKDGGTQITKTWHSLQQHKMKWLPMGFIIKRMAKKERDDLINGWSAAAAAG